MSLFSKSWRWALARFYRRWADVHRHYGNLYGSAQEHWSAVEYYTRAIVLDPGYAQAYFSRAVLYWREISDPARAIEDLSRVIELDPEWSDAYLNRGLALKLHGDLTQAITDFERYLETGQDEFWLDAARGQIEELADELSKESKREVHG
jgi:tetratricopeptide (TPR) repeat protein